MINGFTVLTIAMYCLFYCTQKNMCWVQKTWSVWVKRDPLHSLFECKRVLLHTLLVKNCALEHPLCLAETSEPWFHWSAICIPLWSKNKMLVFCLRNGSWCCRAHASEEVLLLGNSPAWRVSLNPIPSRHWSYRPCWWAAWFSRVPSCATGALGGGAPPSHYRRGSPCPPSPPRPPTGTQAGTGALEEHALTRTHIHTHVHTRTHTQTRTYTDMREQEVHQITPEDLMGDSIGWN